MDARDKELAELRAELERLKKSEAKYRSIFEASPDGIVIHDAETGQFLEVNQRIIEMSKMADITKQPIDNIGMPPPFDIKTGLDKNRKAAQGEPQTFEWRNFGADGREVWLEVTLRGVELDGVTKVLATVRDITVRKQQELHLAKSEERYRVLVENLDDMVFTLDLAGNFTFVSQAIKAFSDFDREEVQNHSFADFIVPEDLPNVASGFQRCMSGEHVVMEFRVNVKDGSTHTVRTSSRPLMDEDGKCELVLGVMTDLTEFRKAEEARQQLEEQLHQSQKMEALGRLAGGVAHDFNNLLFVILNHASLLGMDLDEAHPLKKHCAQIEAAVDKATELTRQLLDFSRRRVLEPKILDLHQELDGLTDMLKRIVGEDVKLKISKGEGVGPIKADPGRLSQVLMNLVVNARDAMPQGGQLEISTEAKNLQTEEHLDLKPKSHVQLSVRDSGQGMSAEVREQAFEPFFTTKPGGQSTGLGLSTAYSAIKQFGGDIHVESEPDKGTCICILLPVTREAPSETPAMGTPVAPDVRDKRILLVEDDPSVRALVAEMLEDFGARVTSFACAEDLIDDPEAGSAEVDLLVTDVILPGMNGSALAEALRQGLPSLAVLYISGYTGDAISQSGLREKDITLLHKPFRANELLAKAHQALIRNGSPSEDKQGERK